MILPQTDTTVEKLTVSAGLTFPRTARAQSRFWTLPTAVRLRLTHAIRQSDVATGRAPARVLRLWVRAAEARGL